MGTSLAQDRRPPPPTVATYRPLCLLISHSCPAAFQGMRDLRCTVLDTYSCHNISQLWLIPQVSLSLLPSYLEVNDPIEAEDGAQRTEQS